MSRIPGLSRDEMDTEQQKVYDATVATAGRVGRGPSVGYAYSPGLWQVHLPLWFNPRPLFAQFSQRMALATLLTPGNLHQFVRP
jgi:hypothetical protein